MAKKKIRKELTIEELVEREKSDFQYAYCTEPSYRFNVGDSVSVGNLQDCVVESVHDGGKMYVIDYTNVDNNYGNPIITPHSKKVFRWESVRPVTENKKSFIKNDDVKISFSQSDINGLIHKVLYFGVDFNPDYQRDLVWNEDDKIALLDSVFNNIDIGKFAFIHLGYNSEYGYQILDGKQRLTTLVDFYLNKFPYKGVYYNELSVRDQRWFMNRSVSVGEMYEASRELILKYFIMLNTTGHVVSKEHLDKVAGLL